MKTRIATGIIGVPIVIALLYLGGNILLLSTYVISIIGLNEFFNATSITNRRGPIIIYLGTTVYYLSLFTLEKEMITHTNYNLFMITLFIIMLIYFVANHEKMKLSDLAISMFSFIYIPLVFSLIYLISEIDVHKEYIWLIFILAFVSDTGAYFTGKAIGKRKLSPKLSPNKTIEGSIGGIVATVVSVYIYILILSGGGITPMAYSFRKNILIILIGSIGAIISQLGDLSSSAIKREYNIKDYGKIIPGHGGILDRFDSVLFTTIYIYILVNIV